MFKDRYELKRPLGQGGMGKVYLAYDKKLNKNWAVKMIEFDNKSRAHYQMAKAELDILKTLNHVNLPRIVDVYESKGKIFIVMDYIEGITLKERLAKRNIKKGEAFKICNQLCSALEYLHSQRIPIIHGDIKPANIICCQDGLIKLIDFGSSIYFGERKNFVSGTMDYLAPEGAKGIINVKTDIYALGKTFEDIFIIAGVKNMQGLVKGCTREIARERYGSICEVRTAFKREQRKNRSIFIATGSVVILLALLMGNTGEKEERPMENTIENTMENTIDNKRDMEQEQAEVVSEHDAQEVILRAKSYMDQGSELLALGKDNQVLLGQAIGLLNESQQCLEELLTESGNYFLTTQEEGIVMEYKIENMSMLSTIYRLLGKKNAGNRKEYYEKAEYYIKELFNCPQVRESSLYRLKLSDLVNIKEELGKSQEAISYLKDWEEEHPDTGKELYFAHACLLLKEKGNRREIEELYDRMKSIDEIQRDGRFAQIETQVKQYLED